MEGGGVEKGKGGIEEGKGGTEKGKWGKGGGGRGGKPTLSYPKTTRLKLKLYRHNAVDVETPDD